jgi:hypothetical protein
VVVVVVVVVLVVLVVLVVECYCILINIIVEDLYLPTTLKPL